MNLPQVAKSIVQWTGRYSPQLLTGLGIAGFITTIIFAVEATPEAYNTIKSEEYKRTADGDNTPVKKTEAVALTWKYYVPATIMGVTSTAMIIGGQYMQYKRLVAMTAAYTIVADQANKYYDKMKEVVGRTKADDGKVEVAKDTVDDIPDRAFETAQSIDGGETYFVDALSGRVFKSEMNNIKKAINEFNYQLMNEMFCTVNDLYNWIGLERTIMGDVVGWNVDKGMVDFKYDTIMRNDKPCIYIRPANFPEARKFA